MRIVAVLFVLLSSSGCYSFGARAIADRSRLEKIVPWETSRTEVVALIGEPTSYYLDSSGTEMWIYSYTSAKANPAQFVPVIGLFVAPTIESHTLTLTFSPDGLVKSIARNQMRSGSGLPDREPIAAGGG